MRRTVTGLMLVRGFGGKLPCLPHLERKRLARHRARTSSPRAKPPANAAMRLTDKFGRAITDLRISITDRCNYKCVYCRTGNEGAIYSDLPIADYLRMARILVGLG